MNDINEPYVAYIMAIENKSYDKVLNSPYTKGSVLLTDSVWGLMLELNKIGIKNFREKYNV